MSKQSDSLFDKWINAKFDSKMVVSVTQKDQYKNLRFSLINGRSYSTKLGEAMSLSAVENQIVLEKPYLSKLIKLANDCGMVGVNTSHSGTVLGVVFESDKDPSLFLKKAEECGYLKPYKRRYIHKIIKGGPIVETF